MSTDRDQGQGAYRRWLRAGSVLACVAMMVVGGALSAQQGGPKPTAAEPTAAEPTAAETTVRGEVAAKAAQTWVENLARGAEQGTLRSVQSALAAISAQPRDRRPQPPKQQTGARIDRALDALVQADPSTLGAAWAELQAASLLAKARLDDIGTRLLAAEGSAQAFERLADARGHHRERVESLIAALAPAMKALTTPSDTGLATTPGRATTSDSPTTKGRARVAATQRAADAVAAMLPAIERARGAAAPTSVLRASQLPFRRAALAPRAPVVEPTIVPSYLDAAGVEPAPSDLASSPSAPLAEEILLQAEALGYDPVRIVEFVRNEIATEWYAGSMRGALGTLRAGRGNDVDQASLLIALLRSSGAATRYVHGVIQLPIGQAANSLGVEGPFVVAALTRAGIAHEPVIQGGTVGAVRVAHTWVSAHLPYTNYRGAVVDFSGRTWVPLMPSVQAFVRTPATNVLDAMGFSATTFIDAYLAAPQALEPLDALRRDIETYLTDQGGGTFDQQLATTTPIAEVLGLVPSSTSVSVVAITGEAAALEDAQRHSVTMVVPDPNDPQAPSLLEVVLPIDELVHARRVTLSYLPATVDDHNTINLFGGLGQVPAFLVDVRPQVKVNGRVMATGAPVGLGVAHPFEITLRGPWDDGGNGEAITQTVVAGSYLAVGIGGPTTGPLGPFDTDPEADPNDTEHVGARLLGTLARDYGSRWDQAEETLADVLDVRVIRPLPWVALVLNRVTVASLFGLPEQVVWQGVDLDAALRIAEPIARSGGADGDDSRVWLKLAALQGSALENQVFEDDFLVAGISADKGLGLARQAGTTVVTVNAGNLATMLPTLAHPQTVLDEVTACVQAGLTVEIPVAPVTLLAWQGAVWRAFAPSGSGAAGYFIAGALAEEPLGGGATAAAPGEWPVAAIEFSLSDPYEPEPNNDPLAAVAIEKIDSTDFQEGTVDALSEPLAVRVIDAEDRPVVGALVTFSTIEGGGRVGDGNNEGSNITIESDGRGIASVPLRYGSDTSVNPRFVFKDTLDRFSTRVSVQWIDASVVGHAGVATIERPFELLAFPGAVAQLRDARYADPVLEHSLIIDQPHRWIDSIRVLTEDAFGNPISNADVLFEVLPLISLADECTNEPSDLRNAAVFEGFLDAEFHPVGCPNLRPILGECGDQSIVVASSPIGAPAGVLAGNSPLHLYRVRASAAGADSVLYRYPQLFSTSPNGSCGPFGGFGEDFVLNAVTNSVNATRSGHRLDRPVSGRVWHRKPDAIEYLPRVGHGGFQSDYGRFPDIVAYWNGRRPSITYQLIDVETLDVDLSVSDGGSVAPTSLLSTSSPFQAEAFAGSEPGVNVVSGDVISIVGAVVRFLPRFVSDAEIVAINDTLAATDLSNATPQQIVGILGGQYSIEPISLDWEAIGFDHFWSVTPLITQLSPGRLQLTVDGSPVAPITVEYEIMPLDYEPPTVVFVDLLRVDGPEPTIIESRIGQEGKATFRLFDGLDPAGTYETRVAVALGGNHEIRSDPVPVPLGLPIIRDYERGLSVSIDVDILNGRSCASPTTFDFDLVQDATVTLAFRAIEGVETSGELIISDFPITLVNQQDFDAGPQSVVVTPDDLLAGRYRMELTATNNDGEVEMVTGSAISAQVVRDRLPVGHIRHRDVNLWNGSLVVGREDLSLPGRGVPLAFRRNYASTSGEEAGWMGVGWSHNYESLLIATGCGEMVVTGGEGAGTRFAPGPDGFVPLAGFHGSLALESDGFAYYTKSGNRYLYQPFESGRYRLVAISDPNGNVTTINYAGGESATKVLSVSDSSGRSLLFSYTLTALRFEAPQALLTEVRGPDGMAVRFTYDAFGNLIQADREALRSESYTYDVQAGSSLRQHLVSVHNESRGGTRAFAYGSFSAQVGFEITLPQTRVTETTWSVYNAGSLLSEGRATFAYDLVANTTSVRDTFDAETQYEFNTYGSPLRIVDPEQNETLMVWAANDVLLEQRTDGNGYVTDFTYDEHGNVLTERVTVQDFDGRTHIDSNARSYHPPGSFDRPIKDRVDTATDRAGGTTSFSYDATGNRTEERVVVDEAAGGTASYKTSHAYLPNGDRRSTTDPRNQTTFFDYDAYGNRSLETDPLGGETEVAWDVRSRPVSSTDALERTTTFTYDTLGRLLTTTHPDQSQETVTYVDITREERRRDALGRLSTTFFDYEGRPVRAIDAAGANRLITYDEEGRKSFESTWEDADTQAQTTSYEYDLAGRLILRTEPLGRITELAYDGVGNVIRETLRDDLGNGPGAMPPRVTEQEWDALNRQVTSRRALTGTATGFVTRHARYDGEGRKVEDLDPLGRVTTMRYDQLGRLIETVAPHWRPGSARVVHRRYDGNGNLLRTTLFNESGSSLPANQVREQTFDALNRVTASQDATGAVTVLTYDAVGNVVRQVDGRGNVVLHNYDNRNRRTKTTVKLDRVTVPARDVVTEFEYDGVGNRIEERWANGNVITHTFDDLNRLVTTTDLLGGVEGAVLEYGYDARGNRVREVDGNGHETVIAYDALDRVIERRLPESRTVTATWDVAGNQLTETNARGLTRTFVYDELNRQVQTEDPAPLSYVRTTEYDDAGNKTAEVDGRGGRTELLYDDLNRVIQRTEAQLAGGTGYVTTMAYDAADNLTEEVDRRGITTAFTYDRENRRLETRRAGLLLETRAYDENGNLAFTTDANGNTVGFDYDERDLQVAINRSLASITRFAYDDMGDRAETTDPEGRIVRETYDARRRLATRSLVTAAGDQTTTFEYDLVGNQTRRELPESGLWQSTYDEADRLVEVIDPEQGTTSYVYDLNGNLTSWTDGAQHTTMQTYDEIDRLVERRYEDGAFETLAYDANGNATSRTDPQGRETVSTFDALNRATLRTYSEDAQTTDDLTSTSFVYDANNNLLEVTETYAVSGAQTETRTYDDFDRVQTVTDRYSKMLQYGYDPNGNRTQLIDPDSVVTLYAYDALNRLSSATTAAGATTYAYQRNSLLDRITYPNGSASQYAYDDTNRVTQINNLHDTVLISSFGYTYDQNGNRVEQVETHSGVPALETTTYEYDLADRLTEVTYPEERVTYTYDGAGNRETEVTFSTVDGALLSSKTLTYNVRNQVTRLEDSQDLPSAVTYGYDPSGNQTARTLDSGGVTTFVYDVRDRMIGVTQDAAPVATYGYDAQGLRISKAVDGTEVRYVYDGQSVLTEFEPSGSTLRRYAYGSDRLLSIDDSVDGRGYYLFDALGSVVDITSDIGTLLAMYQYDAWGNTRNEAGSSANRFGFTGHEHDDETGLIYAKARFYDPQLGRFLSHDPVDGDLTNPPSLHKYLYAFQNPTVFVDPDGRIAVVGNAADKISETAGVEANAARAKEVEEESGKSAGISSAIGGGLVGLVADAAAGAINVVNTVVNVVVAGVAPNSELGQEAAVELNDTIDSTVETMQVVIENPAAVGGAIVDAVVETGKGVARGDVEAITRATAALAGAVGGAKAVKDAAGAARNAAKRVAQRVRRNRALDGSPPSPVVASRGRAPTKCFVAGTLVATMAGLSPIEAVEVGDLVWSRSETTGVVALREVVQTFETPNQAVVEVEVVAADGSVEVLGTTAEHPFWVEGVGWVPAGELRSDDELSTNTDGMLRVRQVRGSPVRATVYNFEVAEDHTYFVGEAGVWVHNACADEGVEETKRAETVVFKDLGRQTIVDQERGRLVSLEPDRSGNPFRDQNTGRFTSKPEGVRVEPKGSLNTERQDLRGAVAEERLAEEFRAKLEAGDSANTAFDAFAHAIKVAVENKKKP